MNNRPTALPLFPIYCTAVRSFYRNLRDVSRLTVYRNENENKNENENIGGSSLINFYF